MLHKLEVPFQILERSMDRLESMSILLTAVEAGSLSAAARQLAIPLSTVSRRISELEAHLKARLLNRSSRKLTLTDAGRSYVEACKRILEDVGEAERAASGESRSGSAAPCVYCQCVVSGVRKARKAERFSGEGSFQ